MSDSINVDTTITTINIVTTGQQGPSGPKGDPGNFDPSVIENMQNQVDNLETEVDQVKTLAQTNELKISTKTDQADFEQAQQQIEQNRLALLSKADIQALALLSQLVDTKADQAYVNEQIANLVGSAPEAINTIYELADAIQNEQGLIEGLNQSVANRVRFDVATQALTEIQKENARTNIGAEKLGTAQQLVSQITALSLGAATAAQGAKADTALQSADVAPVALSGLFSSLGGQSKIFDVVFGAYTLGSNTALAATDTLGQMIGKLQAQINAKSNANVWVDISTVATLSNGVASISAYPLQAAVIEGYLWIRGGFSTAATFGAGNTLFQITNSAYKPRITYPDLSGYITRAGFYASYGTSTAGINGMVGMGFRQNVNGQNFFELTSTSAANSAGFYIPPTPIAKI
ncbi:hypothetical protein [Acinetobacter guerrae]|uniref:hypothetical protein n=1 Tax=Acinetobacter guerrae TaxID=1843371 RepID=UPI00125F02FD|nr:hypothetical protein [Acinetobacter guerrae]